MELSTINADFGFLNGFKVFDKKAFYFTIKRKKRPQTAKVININIFCSDLGTSAVHTRTVRI